MNENNNYTFKIMKTLMDSADVIDQQALLLISQFLIKSLSEKGGFKDRKGNPDLYYTVFGLTCCAALKVNISIKNTVLWLDKFDAKKLSLVDLAGLAKCYRALEFINNKQKVHSEKKHNELLREVKKFLTPEMSYSYNGKSPGFPYAVFLAMNFYQDLDEIIPHKENLVSALEGYLNISSGLLFSTAAALLTYRELTGKIHTKSIESIFGCFSSMGGFTAHYKSEFPDMLSTAVALFTLNLCSINLSGQKNKIGEYIQDHWLSNGAFSANLLDDQGDCEYTYYGLLSLGVLKNV